MNSGRRGDIELQNANQDDLERLRTCTGVVSAEQYTGSAFIDTFCIDRPDLYLRKMNQRCRSLQFMKLRYESNGKHIAAYIVKPAGRQLYPVVIFNRGGNNTFSALTPTRIVEQLSQYASWGYFVIASQYSGEASGTGHDAFGGDDVDDIHNLFPIVNDFPDADERRIAMVGYSRGGMMSYLCMKELPWIRTVVSIAGLSNLIRLARLRPEMQEVFTSCFGGGVKDKLDRSAIHFAHQFPQRCPILLIHGTADDRVPSLDSRELSAALQRYRHPHVLALVQGASHSLLDHSRVLLLQKAWLSAHLKRHSSSPKKSQEFFKKTMKKRCVGSRLLYNGPDALESMVS